MHIASRCYHPIVSHNSLNSLEQQTMNYQVPFWLQRSVKESSSRKLPELWSLSTAEVVVIFLDVTGASNFLHQKKPFGATLFTAILAAPICLYGDKLTNGEWKCQIKVLLIPSSMYCKFARVFSSVKWASRHCQNLTGVTGMMPWLRDSEYARHHSYNKINVQGNYDWDMDNSERGLQDWRIFKGKLQYTCGVARGTKMAGGELNAYNLHPLVTALW